MATAVTPAPATAAPRDRQRAFLSGLPAGRGSAAENALLAAMVLSGLALALYGNDRQNALLVVFCGIVLLQSDQSWAYLFVLLQTFLFRSAVVPGAREWTSWALVAFVGGDLVRGALSWRRLLRALDAASRLEAVPPVADRDGEVHAPWRGLRLLVDFATVGLAPILALLAAVAAVARWGTGFAALAVGLAVALVPMVATLAWQGTDGARLSGDLLTVGRRGLQLDPSLRLSFRRSHATWLRLCFGPPPPLELLVRTRAGALALPVFRLDPEGAALLLDALRARADGPGEADAFVTAVFPPPGLLHRSAA